MSNNPMQCTNMVFNRDQSTPHYLYHTNTNRAPCCRKYFLSSRTFFHARMLSTRRADPILSNYTALNSVTVIVLYGIGCGRFLQLEHTPHCGIWGLKHKFCVKVVQFFLLRKAHQYLVWCWHGGHTQMMQLPGFVQGARYCTYPLPTKRRQRKYQRLALTRLCSISRME